MSEYLDWIGLMTYDYHRDCGVTGHSSPLHGPEPSTEDTVRYWLSKGASPSKLVMGVALYGRSWTLDNANNNWVGAPASIGHAAEYTEEEGYIAYFEVCSGWTYENVDQVGPYAYKGDQWVSFDDVPIVQQKVDFIKQEGLGGALVWAIDLDDFNGDFCGQGKYPFMKALRGAL
jgi:chitinase